jgi:hypothetical protein
MRAIRGFVWLVACSLLSGWGSAIAQNAVTDWSAIAERTVSANRSPASSEVLLGVVHAAMYDAVVAIDGRYRPLGSSLAVDRPASASVAAGTAAFGVLRALVPAQAPALTETYSAWLAQTANDEQRANGIRVGERVASEYLARREGDGAGKDLTYNQPPPAAGVWEPTAPPPAVPVDFSLGRATPLVLESASQFRPSGPPSLTSDVYRNDLAEVKRLGGKDSSARTAAQTETAQFWSEHTAVQWSRTVRNLAIERRLDLQETARMLAMVHVASADAMIACFEAKYHFMRWRPVHAIQRSELSGEAAADKTWQPLLNVNHPEYPSAHGCWTGAVTTALAAYFGTDAVPFSMESTVTKTTRRYARLSDALDEVIEARIDSGLHYRQSMQDGARLGERVARYVVDRRFRT